MVTTIKENNILINEAHEFVFLINDRITATTDELQ